MPKSRGKPAKPYDVRDPEPIEEAKLYRQGIKDLLNTELPSPGTGKVRGAIGTYLLYDLYGLPMYVGRTAENFGARLTVHLSRQRSDVVAIALLDPMEVGEIEVWPLLAADVPAGVATELHLARMEWAVHRYATEQLVAAGMPFPLLFNNALIAKEEIAGAPIPLPHSIRHLTYPVESRERLMYTDLRIARRAAALASIAGHIADRELRGPGSRRTLLSHLYRIQRLAESALIESGGWPEQDPRLPVVKRPRWYRKRPWQPDNGAANA